MKEHTCVVCRDLPILPFDAADVDLDQEYRPKVPRPAPFGGPRSRRCFRHHKAKDRAAKARQAAARSRKRSGLDEEMRQALLALQGGVCAGCGRGAGTTRRVLSADHDHELAHDHDHAEQVACMDCMRGFLCHGCNRHVLGFLLARPRATSDSVATVLENLASYLRYPPMRRLLDQINEQQFDEEPA